MAEAEAVKHSALQHAIKDINAVLETKQNPVGARQVLIDFIVNTIGGCIGPNPGNPEEQIWTDKRAGNLKPETLATYEALATPAVEDPGKDMGPQPKVEIDETGNDIVQDGAEAGPAEKAETEVAGAGVSETQPQECPDFGIDYDPNDPNCAKPCARAEECQAAVAASKKKTTTASQPKEPKAPSARGTMLDLLCGDPTMTKEVLAQKIKEAGFVEDEHYKASTLATVFSDTQQIFKRLQAAGHLAA